MNEHTAPTEVQLEARHREIAQEVVIRSGNAAGYYDSTRLDGLLKHHLAERITAALTDQYNAGVEAGVGLDARIVVEQIEAAVKTERERCAGIVENTLANEDGGNWPSWAHQKLLSHRLKLIAAIRALPSEGEK